MIVSMKLLRLHDIVVQYIAHLNWSEVLGVIEAPLWCTRVG